MHSIRVFCVCFLISLQFNQPSFFFFNHFSQHQVNWSVLLCQRLARSEPWTLTPNPNSWMLCLFKEWKLFARTLQEKMCPCLAQTMQHAWRVFNSNVKHSLTSSTPNCFLLIWRWSLSPDTVCRWRNKRFFVFFTQIFLGFFKEKMQICTELNLHFSIMLCWTNYI